MVTYRVIGQWSNLILASHISPVIIQDASPIQKLHVYTWSETGAFPIG